MPFMQFSSTQSSQTLWQPATIRFDPKNTGSGVLKLFEKYVPKYRSTFYSGGGWSLGFAAARVLLAAVWR